MGADYRASEHNPHIWIVSGPAILLGRWVHTVREHMDPGALDGDEREEFEWRRKENASLRLDNEFLG